ncbi:hypothetical protein [Chitinophaga jiangningensis]|nr:hypothetical protein [Chitinophaga jiangningensis]
MLTLSVVAATEHFLGPEWPLKVQVSWIVTGDPGNLNPKKFPH